MAKEQKKAFEDLVLELQYKGNCSFSDEWINLFRHFWQASRTATLQEILNALPEKKIVGDAWEVDCCDRYSAITYNECLDSIRALIEKRLNSLEGKEG